VPLPLPRVLAALEALAPIRLAGGWDNVGLLLQGTREVARLGLCIDLTEPVADELLAADVDLVVSYHPPLFGGRKRLTEAVPRDRTLLRLIRAGVHVYSPHSALDAAPRGMADWLLDPFGACSEVHPIAPDALDPTVGAGRQAVLVRPRPLDELLPALAAHLGLRHLRVAGASRDIGSVAVCPGAGGSLFETVDAADLFLTGEMRHHDVLARVEAGQCVVLTDHTNTERGYLPVFAGRLAEATGLPVVRSTVDADPLRVWSA